MSAFTDIKKRNGEAREFKRQEILDAYCELVMENGFENTSISKIAAEVGIPSSLVFHYFKNKQELTYSLIDYVLEQCIQDSLPEVNWDSADVKNEFEMFIHRLFDIQSSYKMDPRVYFACHTMALRDPVAKEKFIKHFQQSEEYMREILECFAEKNVIKPDKVMTGAGLLNLILEGLENAYDFSQEPKKTAEFGEECKKIMYQYLGFSRNEA